jgi:hypothetical protein
MLAAARNRIDPVVVRRFRRLCDFLDRHRDVFRTRRFDDQLAEPGAPAVHRPPPTTGVWLTAGRMMEQAMRVAFR